MADNQPVTSALFMDRSTPLGSSEGKDTRQALHVLNKNPNTDPSATRDTVDIFGTSTSLNVTTTAQEIKVGATRDARRRFIYLQVQGSGNVRWGFSPSTCVFTAPNNSIIILAIGDVATFIRTTTGSATVAIAEAG